MIFESNSLPYVQRTIVSERDSSSASVCIDDSGGGGGGGGGSAVVEIPIDNNNIGDDVIDNNGGSDHILKRNSASVLQRHSFETVENENDDDDDDEDETSQGELTYLINFLQQCVSNLRAVALLSNGSSYNNLKHVFTRVKFNKTEVDLFWFQYE